MAKTQLQPYILFSQDMLKQGAHVHWETKNTSWIRISIVLQRMGIANRYFFLALLQPELKNVDPHDPHLADEIKAKILVECKLNPWYFFRECLTVPAAGGENAYFELHRSNLAALWTMLNSRDCFLVQPRQTGKSYVSGAYFTYLLFVATSFYQIGHYNKDASTGADLVRKIKELKNGLPEWMVEKSTADIDRKESLSYAKLHNEFKTFAAPIDERSALKLGRGQSFHTVHYDEVAFINYNHVIISTATNTMLRTSEQARKAGLPSSVIYSTTAGNPDTKSGAFALNIVQNSLPFTEAFYDLNGPDDIDKLIENAGTSNVIYLEFSYRQLGKTDKWFKEACERSHDSPDGIARDLLNIWQSASDNAVIPQRLLVKMRESKRDPSFTDISDGFVVRWYLDRSIVESDEFKARPLVMGMDTSENIGRDFTTFVIMDPTDMKVVATCRCNDSNTMQIARHVLTLLTRYENMVWIPERNNTGTAIIDFVLEELQKKNINPYFRIYNEVIQQLGEPKFKNVSIHDFKEIHGQVRGSFGYRTAGAGSSSSRNNLYKATMMKYLEMNYSRLYDGTLISEYCNLTEKNGRIDHPDGCHDDTVISNLLCAYLIYFGKNLKYYGIPESIVLQSVSASGQIVPETERLEQLRIRRRMSELEDALSIATSSVLKASYERELNNLRPLVNTELTAVAPMAISQIRHEERQLADVTGASAEQKLRGFAARWNRL